MRYDAFISYSHSTDSDLAPSLEEGLEKFAKPIFQRSALRIFRDANDLSASPNLWGTIEQGLARSDYFIFMASPRAAQSKWCRREVEYWKANKAVDHFLIVLTEGELVWDDAAGDFDWDRTTAIPSNLSGVFTDEPLFVDFRERPAVLSLDDPDFRQKIVLLAATIHGRTIEEMIGEGVRQHKRTLRIRNGAIALLSILLLAAVALGIFALQQKTTAEANEQLANEKAIEADTQRNRAIRQANEALAKSYLLGSKENLDLDPTLAMKLAVHGYRFAQENGLALADFRDELIHAAYNTTHFYNQTSGDPLDEAFPALPFLAKKEAGYRVFRLDNGDLMVETPAGGRKLVQVPKDIMVSEIDSVVFAPDGNYAVVFFSEFFVRNIGKGLLVVGANGSVITHVLSVDEIRDRIAPAAPSLRSSADGRRVVVSGERQTIVFGNDADGLFRKAVLTTNQSFPRIAISPDGTYVALGRADGRIELMQLRWERSVSIARRWQLHGHRGEPLTALTFSADNTMLDSQSENLRRRWRTDGVQPYVQLANDPSQSDATPEVTGGEGQLTIGPMSQDGWPTSITWQPGGAKEPITFSELNDFSQNYEQGSRLVSGDYYVTPQGLYNQANERLIDLGLSDSYLGMGYYEACGFSENGQYLFAKDKIYGLDPEWIIARFAAANDGQVAPFTEEEKEKYLIEE